MKLELKDFQDAAVDQLIKKLTPAKREVAEGGDRQAVILAAPTGSGKTVITAALIEEILNGSDHELVDAGWLLRAGFPICTPPCALGPCWCRRLPGNSSPTRSPPRLSIAADFCHRPMPAAGSPSGSPAARRFFPLPAAGRV